MVVTETISEAEFIVFQEKQDSVQTILDLLSKILGGQGLYHLNIRPQAKNSLALNENAIILIDNTNSGEQGLDWIRWFCEENPAATVWVLLAVHDRRLSDQVLGLGACDYLVDGSVTQDLLEKMLAYVNEKKFLEGKFAQDRLVLENLINNMPGMVFRCRNDHQWNMEMVSDGVYALTGYQPQDFINNHNVAYTDLIVPEDRPMVWENIQEALKKKKTYQISYQIFRADGKRITVWEQGRGFYAEDGNVQLVEGYIVDISEKESILGSLYQSQQQLNAAVSSFDDVVFTLDREQRHTGVFGRWLDKYQLSPESFLGKTPRDIFGDDARVHEDANLRALQGERVIYDWTIQQGNENIFFQASLSPILDHKKNITGLLGVSRDVTLQKRADETLKRYALLSENSRDIILFIRYTDGQIMDANLAAVQTYGYSKDELLQKTVFDLRSSSTVKDARPHLNQANKDGNFRFETEHHRKDGTCFPVEVNSHRAEIDGQIWLMNIVRDISERKQHEKKIMESQRFFQAISDALAEEICVLDHQGAILNTNEAWKVFAANNQANDPAKVGVGINYLEVMRRAIEAGEPHVQEMLAGILDVMQGKSGEFHWEYPCNSPYQERWFEMRVHPISVNGASAVITHTNITDRKLHVREVEAVNTLTLATRNSHNLPDLLSIFLDEITRLVNCERAAFVMLDSTQSGVNIFFSDTPNQIFKAMEWDKMKTCPFLKILESGVPFSIPLSENSIDLPFGDLLDPPGQLTGLPLLVGQKSLGVLFVKSRRDFYSHEIRILESLADIAANAVQRSNLFELTEKRLANLRALRGIDQAILENLDFSSMVEMVIEVPIQSLGADAVSYYRFDAENERAILVAEKGFRRPLVAEGSLGLDRIPAPLLLGEEKLIQLHNLHELAYAPMMRDIRDEGFRSYYALPVWDYGTVVGVLEIYYRSTHYLNDDEMEFLQMLAGEASIAIEHNHLLEHMQSKNQELMEAYDATLAGWSRTLALRDEETEDHTKRVTEMTVRLALWMGFTEQEVVHIRRGALLHDIGKMGVPDSILRKPGPLSKEEWQVMHQHPVLAYEQLKTVRFLQQALDIPYCHHEKWDGSGYPRGLKGQEIPLAARIFAIIDVWDALTSDRPYRNAWNRDDALAYIQSEAGKHFDPMVVHAFESMLSEEFS